MNESLTPELDRVAFQQVWRRVMPEDRPDCPFTLEAPTLPTVTSTPVPVVSAAPEDAMVILVDPLVTPRPICLALTPPFPVFALGPEALDTV